MTKEKIGEHALKHQPRKRVPTEDGRGETTVPDGPEETVTLEVWIDVAKLVQAIGYKALRSKRGRSRLQEGAVEVRRKR